MSGLGKAFDEAKELLQLSVRVKNVADRCEKLEELLVDRFDRLDDRINGLLERVARLEAQAGSFASNVRNEIIGEIRDEVATVRTVIGLLPQLKRQAPETRELIAQAELLTGKRSADDEDQ